MAYTYTQTRTKTDEDEKRDITTRMLLETVYSILETQLLYAKMGYNRLSFIPEEDGNIIFPGGTNLGTATGTDFSITKKDPRGDNPVITYKGENGNLTLPKIFGFIGSYVNLANGQGFDFHEIGKSSEAKEFLSTLADKLLKENEEIREAVCKLEVIKNKARENAEKITALGLKTGTPELEVLSEIIESGEYCIKLNAAGGAFGRRQINIDKVFTEDWIYSSDIYDTLSELLQRSEENILAGNIGSSDMGRCHKCIEPNYIGENDLETWLIIRGSLYCSKQNDSIVVEARKRGKNPSFFVASGKTLGGALSNMNEIMGEYNISELEGMLNYGVDIDEASVKKALERVKKIK